MADDDKNVPAKRRQVVTTQPSFTNDSVPDLFVDHLAGVSLKHGIAKLLFIKHRPFIGDSAKVKASDLVVESCILSTSEDGLRELSKRLNTYIENLDGEEEEKNA